MTPHQGLVVLLPAAVAATPSCGRDDDRRADLLRDDPIVDEEPDGAELTGEGGGEGTSLLGGSPNHYTRHFDVNDPPTFVLDLTTAAIAAGWTIGDDDFSVNCALGDGYEINGSKVIDGLTAYLEIVTLPRDDPAGDWWGTLTLDMARGDDAEDPPRERQALTVDDLDDTCLGDEN